MRNNVSVSNGRLAVIYLARQAEGIDPLNRFVRSYQSHEAGAPHDLVVLYKGYQPTPKFDQARAVFAGLPHQAIEIDDNGFDIDAYFTAARRINHSLVCFLNTYTAIAASGWLAALDRQASKSHVGVAGAMGSFESVSSSSLFIQEIVQRCLSPSYKGNATTNYYFDFVLSGRGGQMPARGGSWPQSVRAAVRRRLIRVCKVVRAHLYTPRLSSAHSAQLSRFPSFPNPHIRSNGFMMSRERFLETGFPAMSSKWDAYAFESGSDGLTARLRRQGWATVVVDRTGQGYDVDAWCQSGMFRIGTQRNLLLSDNQTRMFAGLAPGHQATVERMTWGDYLGPAPADFPGLGFSFARDPSAIAPRLAVSASCDKLVSDLRVA
ncbi:MAG TPA: hypothetical protein VGZ26_01025 [Pirellulales bacterium]|nr:hypothetical protein [Pirellulales bacterium]